MGSVDSTYFRLLVRGPNWIGDQVMARPLYLALRKTFPKAYLGLLAPDSVAGLGDFGVFDSVLSFPYTQRRDFRGLSGLIAAGGWHSSLCLPASYSAAYPLKRAQIPRRLGFSSGLSGAFLYHVHQRWPGREATAHKSQIYLSLLNLFNQPINKVTPPVSEPRATRINEVLLAPGASISLREWPYWVELAKKLRQKYPHLRLVVVGAGKDRKWSSQFGRLKDSEIEDLIGQTSLSQLRERVATAQLVVANDSGLAHVSATLEQTPTVVLMGPGNPDYISPLGPSVSIARLSELGCSPCESATCAKPLGYKRCLKDLNVDSVFKLCEERLLVADPLSIKEAKERHQKGVELSKHLPV